MMEEDWVRFPRVGTPNNDEIGLLDLPVGASTPTCSKHCRQTDDGWSVSGAVAAIDVIAAHHESGKLLGDVIRFVGRLGATEQPKGIALVQAQPGGGLLNRLLEAGRPESAIFSHKRLFETGVASSHPHLLSHLIDPESTRLRSQ